MDAWTWQFEAADGTLLSAPDLPVVPFPNQADAESWVGESWRDLVAKGVEQVSLLHDDQQVYGPMSLRPPQ
jgi:hypothetical protein